MEISKKKIYFVLSPHINYYHSYRGDSKGKTGFGKDLAMMRGILDELDEIEDMNLKFGNMRMCWDYADTFFSIQLQKEYQHDVLDRVIERCKAGKDEVLIGSWGNVAQSVMDTEEFLQQHDWFLENFMGIGVNQLFPGRVAPYARTQESMFTQGMIELYNKIGVKGICNYYSMYGFDASRPYINPRLDWDQRYGLIKFKSTLSEASCLMIPTYAFGDILDFYSIKKWFEYIRKRQEMGDISGHALIFLNFDMDYENWVGLNLPKFMKWMPNSRGVKEFAEAVDQYDYVEFTNLIDIVPNLEIHGDCILREDVADGMWNGYYNWAQKYDNTKFWTLGQEARWLKCISDTLISNHAVKNSISEINDLLRNIDESHDSYMKNKILFASTTNFGMAMPFLHSDRRKTAMNFGLKAFYSSERATKLAIKEALITLNKGLQDNEFNMFIMPITNRGISEKEKIELSDFTLVKMELPSSLSEVVQKKGKFLRFLNTHSNEELKSFNIHEEHSNLIFEALIPRSDFTHDDSKMALYAITFSDAVQNNVEKEIGATENYLKNKYLYLKFDENGKIISFKFKGKEFAVPKFLESSISYGNTKKPKRYYSKKDKILIQRDGSDGFSASVIIQSEFFIEKEYLVQTEKRLKLYNDLPSLFVEVSMKIPPIQGKSKNIGRSDGTSYFVEEEYQNKWQEIIPCEIRSNILGVHDFLKVWKHNFLGVTDYFTLDMKEVDSKNANIDCLVANISDGWMALTDNEKGLLIGFDSLKAANFAFSPIKIKDKGFGDTKVKAQQVRINPFGTYYGKSLHYWTKGNGHAQKIVAQITGTNESTAPTFSGKTLSFDLIMTPFLGDNPPKSIQSSVDHFSFKPLIIITQKEKQIYTNYENYSSNAEKLVREFNLEELMKLSYIEWVKKVNENFKPPVVDSPSGIPKLSLKTLLMMLIDGIKGR